MEYYNKLIELVAEKKALVNKASIYLAPCLTYLEPKLRNNLLMFSKPVNVRIYNEAVINTSTNNLSIIVEIKDFAAFNQNAKLLRDLDCYIADHSFYKAFSSSNLHTFVFKLDYPGAIESFLNSKYSQMYREKDAYEIFKIRKTDSVGMARIKKGALSVCIKDPVHRGKYEAYINTVLSKVQHEDTWISLPEDVELDTLIKQKDEFYYGQKNESIRENTGVEQDCRDTKQV
jgi:hypothetical protein